MLSERHILLQKASNILRDVSILINEKRFREAERLSNYHREEILPHISLFRRTSGI